MKNKAVRNIVASVTCQIITIVSGLIVPRIFLKTFGSDANGLVASITQLLNYIALVEGGLGGAVLTSLYGPLARKDNDEISRVLVATNKFFRQISYIFVLYVFVLMIIYPFVIKTGFSWIFIASLVVILALSLFIQYFFSITYKLLLQADQRMYIVQITQIITTLLNLLVFCLTIKIFPNLHIVKLFSALVFVVQPIIYGYYVRKRYTIDLDIKGEAENIPQRWACFGLNLAFFIHENTDIVILSLLSNMKVVSIYSVYLLVVNNLKGFFKSFSHAFSPLIGKAIATEDNDKAVEYLDMYEYVVTSVATVVFGISIYLLPDFVLIYTKGVDDANYFQPIFSCIILLAEMVYCVRDPYASVVNAAGKFKETTPNAVLEAVLNIVISLLLVKRFGLVGIAIGTFSAMVFRMVYLIYYMTKNLVHRSIIRTIKRFAISLFTILCSLSILNTVNQIESGSIISWIKSGVVGLLVFSPVLLIVNLLFDKKETLVLIGYMKKR